MTRCWRLAAAIGVLALCAAMPLPADTAVAATDDGLTDSAVTLPGGPADNGDDFSSLRVTVAQTKGLVNQTVKVSWTGAAPTVFPYAANYVAIMQCWGPDPDAVDFVKTCLFGGELPTPYNRTSSAGTRFVFASTGSYGVPFLSATGTEVDGGNGLRAFFDVQSTNEVPWTLTSNDGVGSANFEVQTASEAPHLGCGAALDGVGAAPRACWLVVVPRGDHRADGTQNVGSADALGDSPLSPSVWSGRIVFPLEFEPVAGVCPAGRAERRTGGSEMAGEAMSSWQSALCQSGDVTYGYASTPDAVGRLQVLEAGTGAPGLVFTQRPAVRDEDGPTVLHAPTLATGAVVAFNIEKQIDDSASPEQRATNGQPVTELTLTPRLVAKLLTQSYRADVPDGNTQPHVKDNPRSLRDDKEFLDLNPEFAAFTARARPGGLMVAGQSGDAAYEVWRWIKADPAARAWLAGEADDQGPGKTGMVVNPKYATLELDTDPSTDSYPKIDDATAVSYCADVWTGCYPFGTQDAAPYQSDMRAAALQTLKADNRAKALWDPQRQPPTYTANGPQATGARWSMAITDAASAARYGLPTASLRNQAGTFVAPTTESLSSGIATMQPSEVPDVLTVVPTAKKADAYPLTMLSYAAVNVDAQDANARAEYADLIRYAVGPGQTPGVKRGELPPGYVPLPAALKARALEAADEIESYVPVVRSTTTPTPPVGARQPAQAPAPPATSSVSGTTTPPSGGTAPPAAAASTGPVDTAAPPAAADPAGPVIVDASTRPVARATAASSVGAVRFALLGALGVGLMAAVGGPLLLRASRRPS